MGRKWFMMPRGTVVNLLWKRKQVPTMNCRSPWGAAAEQVKEKIEGFFFLPFFLFFLNILNYKLELINFNDLLHSPRVCSLLLLVGQTLMAVCKVILRGWQFYTVIQVVHWLIYIVSKCCPMERYHKIFTKIWGVYPLLWDTVCSVGSWELLSSLLLQPPLQMQIPLPWLRQKCLLMRSF